MSEPTAIAAPRDCEHTWEPAGLAFETQLLDEHGRVRVRQPDINAGRCYFICRKCASHTYQETQWIGYQLYGAGTVRNDQGPRDAYYREAWEPGE